MLLPIDLTDEKKQSWASLIGEFLASERIPHKELDSLTGRLSFAQTSIFGRFGRDMVHPLYRKLYGCYYDESLSDVDRITMEWRSCLLTALRPRTIYPRNNSPGVVIFTDAATTAMIMAIVIFRKTDFDADNSAMACQGVVSDPGWAEYFTDTSLIYGLELTALVLTTADPNLPLGGLCITYYIDNNCAKCALIRGGSRIAAIAVLARLFWAICAIRRITPWLERAPTGENIADLPTRTVELPYHIGSISDFPFEKQLLQMDRVGLAKKNLNGFSDHYELVGVLYPNIFGRNDTAGFETAPLDELFSAIIRSLSFSDVGASDIWEWLADNPGVTSITMGREFCSDLTPTRILEHTGRRASLHRP